VDGLILTSESETCYKTIELGRGNNFSIELAGMFNTKTKYIAERPGEARITLCDTSEANIKVGYKPQVNLDDYIEGIVNE